MSKSKTKTIRRVLAGTDFSRAAANAVARAAVIAAEHAAELKIIHATTPVSTAAIRRFGLDPVFGREPDPETRDSLKRAEAVARKYGSRAVAEVIHGGAAESLAREANRYGADLVVVGARGHRMAKNASTGTTAERLTELCGRDVLIVHRPVNASYNNILICIALGPVSGHVVTSACALAPNAGKSLLHVYEPPFERKLISYGANPDAVASHRNAVKGDASRAALDLIEKYASPELNPPSIILKRGGSPGHPAYRVLLVAAQKMRADLVVIGKNQPTISGILLGNTTKHILRDASTDTLIAASR